MKLLKVKKSIKDSVILCCDVGYFSVSSEIVMREEIMETNLPVWRVNKPTFKCKQKRVHISSGSGGGHRWRPPPIFLHRRLCHLTWSPLSKLAPPYPHWRPPFPKILDPPLYIVPIDFNCFNVVVSISSGAHLGVECGCPP